MRVIFRKEVSDVVFCIGLVSFLFTSCVQDTEGVDKGKTNGEAKLIVLEKGAVPKESLVYKVMFEPSKFTTVQLDEMYKEDVSKASEDYMTNLKNMWFVVLNKKLVNEGTDSQKLFYINEQLKMENNLPNIKSFYDLLLSASLSEADKTDIANRFSVKNKEAVGLVYADDVQAKKEKLTELTYQKRSFERFASLK